MAVTYGFYNSLNKDRMYNAEQMSAIFDGIITDGVFSAIGDALMPVAGTGMQVIVKTGKCWFNSTWTLNDAQLPLDIETADVSLTRIDAIVVEINSAVATRANSIKIIKGTPSANPAKPTLSATETLHQYALGYVTVAANATSITSGDIEVNVGKSSCPFITSVLQQTDVDELFNQWEAEFNTWFTNIQAQLSGDVAANLQRQIDLLNNKIDSNWEKTLSDYTKTLLGIPKSSTPDDAFQALLVGTTNKAYRVKVQYPDGTPAVGYTVGGIEALPTTSLVTDSTGTVLGKSESETPTITVEKKYDDVKAASVTAQSVGTITNVVITLEYDEDVVTVTSSINTTLNISPKCTGIDYLLAGGGGGCGAVARNNALTTECQVSGGGAGGGGYSEQGTISNPENGATFAITVGSGGAKNSNGKNGGTTSLSLKGSIIASAAGGNGGKSATYTITAVTSSTNRYDGTGGTGGTGNGNGGNGASNWVSVYTDPKDDDTEWSGGGNTSAAASGTEGSTVTFHGVPYEIGGGGGGCGGMYNSNGYSNGIRYPNHGTSQAKNIGGGGGYNGGNYSTSGASAASAGNAGRAFYAYVH